MTWPKIVLIVFFSLGFLADIIKGAKNAEKQSKGKVWYFIGYSTGVTIKLVIFTTLVLLA